ncbi:MAG: hypothetical protein ACOC2Y_05170 [Spirochaetota bacterium]
MSSYSLRGRTLAMALFVLALSVPPVITAEEPADTVAPYEAFPGALGIAYGEISGTGLHYHRWNGSTGFGFAGGIVYLPIGSSLTDTTLDYNLGGAFQWPVYADTFAPWLAGSLYIFAGAHHRGYIPIVYEEVAADEIEAVTGSFQAEIGAGGGIGIEIILFQHFSIPAEFGYGADWTITETNLGEAFRVQLYAQTALRYRY